MIQQILNKYQYGIFTFNFINSGVLNYSKEIIDGEIIIEGLLKKDKMLTSTESLSCLNRNLQNIKILFLIK